MNRILYWWADSNTFFFKLISYSTEKIIHLKDKTQMSKFLMIQESLALIVLRKMISDLSIYTYLLEEKVIPKSVNALQAQARRCKHVQWILKAFNPTQRLVRSVSLMFLHQTGNFWCIYTYRWVFEKRHDGIYKLACKHSVLKSLYFRSYLEPLPRCYNGFNGLVRRKQGLEK